MLKLFFIGVLCINLVSADGNFTITHNFKLIGEIATGLSWGHMYAKINFKDLDNSFKSLVNHYFVLMSNATPESAAVYGILEPAFKVSKTALADIRTQFFLSDEEVSRDKRQILGGIAIAMSAVNEAQIIQLQFNVGDLREMTANGFDKIIHVIQEEDNSINDLVDDVNTLSHAMKALTVVAATDRHHINALSGVVAALAFLRELDASVASWGRGLDSLQAGHIHPAIIDSKKLLKSFKSLTAKAKKIGMRPLHPGVMHLYKDPASFITTKDGFLHIYIHVPLIDTEPMKLFEHLPIPHKLKDLYFTLEGDKKILATDYEGRSGLELTQGELDKCMSEELKKGKLYTCPDQNVVKNNVRHTCLGALYFGNKEEVVKKCKFFPLLPEETERAVQTAANEVTLFTAKEEHVVEACPNSLREISRFVGVKSIVAKGGCKIVTPDHTFRSPAYVDEDSNFIKTVMEFEFRELFPNQEDDDLEKIKLALDSIKTPARIDLSRLTSFLHQMRVDNLFWKITTGVNLMAVGAAIVVIIILGYLFARYRREKRRKREKKQLKMLRRVGRGPSEV